MKKDKYSSDPKVNLLSIEDFFDKYSNQLSSGDYLLLDLLEEGPEPDDILFHFSSDKLVCIIYGYSFTNFGMDISAKLERIDVAFRNGVDEYKLLNNVLSKIKNVVKKKNFKNLIDRLPEYKENKASINNRQFQEYLIDTKFKTDVSIFKKKYVVFDVETNGLRRKNDDLLSLSIFDPATGICYNRFFPLDLQPVILTKHINGITEKMLDNTTHINQQELDEIINYFDLKNKVLLSFSGGEGTFDIKFFNNYCNRHNAFGFDELEFQNIKSLIPSAPFGSSGELTKDNLCKLFGIEGISDIHSSLNDCLLEWRLFEKLKNNKLFFISNNLFAYKPGYIVPITYLIKYPVLYKYAEINRLNLTAFYSKIYEYSVDKKTLKIVKKFSTNITGISLENAINYALQAEEQDSFEFLAKNKAHLEYIGTIDSEIDDIPVYSENGLMMSVDEEDEAFVKEVNDVTKTVVDKMEPLLTFIKKSVFNDSRIMSKELVVSDDNKILSLCDLSSKKSILEIKTYEAINDEYIDSSLLKQLYYESKNRNVYVLTIVFCKHRNDRNKEIIDSLTFNIYEVKISAKKYEPIRINRLLMDWEYSTLSHIKDNPFITAAEIARLDNRTPSSVGRTINVLCNYGYITKEEFDRKHPWIVLKTNREYTIVIDEENNTRYVE